MLLSQMLFTILERSIAYNADRAAPVLAFPIIYYNEEKACHKSSASLNLALMQHLQFVCIHLAHMLKRFKRFLRLLFIDLAHGKAYMDQDPIPRRNPFTGDERDIDPSLDTGHVDLCDLKVLINDLYNLTRNTKTHRCLLTLYRTPHRSNSLTAASTRASICASTASESPHPNTIVSGCIPSTTSSPGVVPRNCVIASRSGRAISCGDVCSPRNAGTSSPIALSNVPGGPSVNAASRISTRPASSRKHSRSRPSVPPSTSWTCAGSV